MANSARAPHTGDEDDPAPFEEPVSIHRRQDTIGDLLRRTRLSYHSEIGQIAAALRVRAVYLTAIEQGQYDKLPGLVYALGFVRTYANHLGLDGDEAVRRFKLEAAGLERPRDLTFPVPLTRRSMPGGRILLAAFILAVCGYGLWYYLITGDRARPERVAAVPVELLPPKAAPVAIPLPSPTESAAATRLPPAGTASASPPPANSIPASSTSATSPTGAQASIVPVVAAAIPPAVPPDVPAAPGANPGAAPPDAPAAAAAKPAPSNASQVPSAPTVAMTAPPPPPPASAAPAAAEPPAAAPEAKVYGAVSGPVRVVIRANGDSWIQVRDSDAGQALVAQRLLHAGDSYRVPPDKSGLVLSTGNASTLSIAVDGKPTAGLSGTVRRNIHLDPDRLLAGTAIE